MIPNNSNENSNENINVNNIIPSYNLLTLLLELAFSDMSDYECKVITDDCVIYNCDIYMLYVDSDIIGYEDHEIRIIYCHECDVYYYVNKDESDTTVYSVSRQLTYIIDNIDSY